MSTMGRRQSSGVTLVELVITIAIMGIIAAIAAMILTPSFEAYFATQRRGQLADVADTAVRRMTRDIRLALPNSPRVDGTSQFLEILLTKNGGRYRAFNDNNPLPPNEDPLDFTTPDNIFDTLGVLPAVGDQQVQAGDWVAIHNLGIAGANAYDTAAASRNIAQIGAFGAGIPNENRITLTAGTQFALESPGRRFFVVQGPVTYECRGVAGIVGGNGTGTLRRWSGYAIQLAQPVAPPVGATDAVLANNVSACNLQYTPLPLASRGLVAVRIAITRANETVTLYYEAHVNNVP